MADCPSFSGAGFSFSRCCSLQKELRELCDVVLSLPAATIRAVCGHTESGALDKLLTCSQSAALSAVDAAAVCRVQQPLSPPPSIAQDLDSDNLSECSGSTSGLASPAADAEDAPRLQILREASAPLEGSGKEVARVAKALSTAVKRAMRGSLSSGSPKQPSGRGQARSPSPGNSTNTSSPSSSPRKASGRQTRHVPSVTEQPNGVKAQKTAKRSLQQEVSEKLPTPDEPPRRRLARSPSAPSLAPEDSSIAEQEV